MGGGSGGRRVGVNSDLVRRLWGEAGDFWSVGFVVVVLTLVGPFIIALRFFARPLVTPMREGGGVNKVHNEVGACV